MKKVSYWVFTVRFDNFETYTVVKGLEKKSLYHAILFRPF